MNLFPFVPKELFWRASHEADRLRLRVAELEESLRLATGRAALGEAHTLMYSALNVRYNALEERYHALKLAGAAVPDVPKVVEVDVVTQAIVAKSNGNPVLRKHFAQYIHGERARGVSEEVIAAGIMEGELDNEGVP